MAIRSVPKREAMLDDLLRKPDPDGNDGPGVRQYVFTRIDKGADVSDLVQDFKQQHNIVVPSPTLYKWIKRWKSDAQQSAPHPKPTRRHKAKAETETADVEGVTA